MIAGDSMNLQISIEVADYNAITPILLDESGYLKDTHLLGDGVSLSPKFTTIKTKRAIGASDILNFVLSVPVGIGTGVIANVLYAWLTKSNVQSVRIEQTEIIIKDEKGKVIHLITKTLSKN